MTLTSIRWPSYTNSIRRPWRYTACANINFLRQGFRKLSSDRQTHIQCTDIQTRRFGCSTKQWLRGSLYPHAHAAYIIYLGHFASTSERAMLIGALNGNEWLNELREKRFDGCHNSWINVNTDQIFTHRQQGTMCYLWDVPSDDLFLAWYTVFHCSTHPFHRLPLVRAVKTVNFFYCLL